MSLRPGRALALDQLMSRPLGWGNFDRVLHQSTTWAAFLNSGIYTVGTLIPAFLFGLLVALLFNRVFPARRWLRSLLLLPWAVPGVIVSITFLWMLDASFGVVNSVLRRAGLIVDRRRVVRERGHRDARGDRADRLEELPVLRDHDPRRAAGDPRRAVRGGEGRRRARVAAVPLRDLAVDRGRRCSRCC